MDYEKYKHLIGRRYVAGAQDCYGLLRDLYSQVYGVGLTDIARPDQWWDDPEFNIIADFMERDGWRLKSLNTRGLKEGDGLIFSLLHSSKPNHIGVYVGNSTFLHHVFTRNSCDEPLLPKWTSRLLMVVEHPAVVSLREKDQRQTDYASLLPEQVKRYVTTPPQS